MAQSRFTFAVSEVRTPSLFQEYPAGRVGLGLLLFRSAVGILVLAQVSMQLSDHTGGSLGERITRVVLIAAGSSLLAGFLTPIAATLVGLHAVRAWISVIPQPLLLSKPLLVFFFTVAAGIVLAGPGAFSVDARLFGLREVIIPRPPRK